MSRHLPLDTGACNSAAPEAAARDRARIAQRLIGASIDLGGLAILLTQAWRMG